MTDGVMGMTGVYGTGKLGKAPGACSLQSEIRNIGECLGWLGRLVWIEGAGEAGAKPAGRQLD